LASFDMVDQADGLRRMLERPKPRLFTFLSVLPDLEKQSVLFNIGASLHAAGSHAILVDAGVSACYTRLVGARTATLLDVARRERTLDDVIEPLKQGFSLALLARQNQPETQPDALQETLRAHAVRIAEAFDSLAEHADIVMLNGALDANDAFPITAMDDGEIVIQVSTNSTSIKSAYVLLKRLSDKLGRRRFSLLVTGGAEKEAQRVYDNIAQAASRYLATQLDFLGAIPCDEHLAQAAGQGRTVVDAYPLARASLAFKHIAGQFLMPPGAYRMPSGGIPMGV
jgi:flagellar biosynthesis protein FlhG